MLASDTPLRAAQTVPPGHDIPVQDWQGQAIDCGRCAHQDLLARGECQPGRSCVHDAYARRIDRFFREHRSLAVNYLDHPYFEVRAIAARHADTFHLPSMMADEDETVRLQVALRLPQRLLAGMRSDPHREVRIRVASRLDPALIMTMASDEDYEVRRIVARRAPLAQVVAMRNDPEPLVRKELAVRLDMPALWAMVGDPDAGVRCLVAEHLPVALLSRLQDDIDWTVRHVVASRATGDTLAYMVNDPEPDVAECASRRWAAQVTRASGALPDHDPDVFRKGVSA